MAIRPNPRNVRTDRDALRPYFGARNADRGIAFYTTMMGMDIAELLNASFITVNTETKLNAERVLTDGAGLTGTDGGANSTYTLAAGEGPGIDITADAVGLGGDTILLFDNGGSPVAEQAATNAGFAAAIAAAGAGDLIQLPLALTLSAAHEVPAGVTVRGPCVITASGDYTALLTVNSTSVLEELEIDYTTTSTSGNIAAIYGAEIGTLRHIKATVTNSTHAAGTYGLKANNVADGTCIHNCYFNAVGNVAGGTRIGIYIITPAGSDGRNISITNVIGRGYCNSSGSTCYGIHLEGTQRRTVLDGCIGFGHAQWSDGTSYGIYTQNALLTGCVGETGDTGTGYGIYCDSGRLFGCHGYGTTTGAGTAAGIYLGDEGYAYNCRAEVVTTGGTEYGFYCNGANTYIFGGQCDGHETDLYINSGTCNVCGVQYETTAGAGTLNYLQGDRSAYSVENYHANDIEAAALTRHLPASGTTSNIVVDDGTNWQSVAMSGDATIAANGAVTVSGATGTIPLTDLTSYARGSIIRGGAADWEAYSVNTNGAALVGDGTDIVCDLTPTWQSTHTFQAGITLAGGDLVLPDGCAIGIASNETLTVNAAGNFTFSAAVTSVVVNDGTWVGADAACSWVFDSSNGDVTTLDKVGIGTAAPQGNAIFHVENASSEVTFLLGEDNASVVNTTGYKISPWSDNNIYIDSKLSTGGKIYWRYGEGAETGYAHEWMIMDGGSVGLGITPAAEFHLYRNTSAGALLRVERSTNRYFVMTGSGLYAYGDSIVIGTDGTAVQYHAAGAAQVYLIAGALYPYNAKACDLGLATNEWDDLYYVTEHVGTSRMVDSTRTCPGCGGKMHKGTGGTSYAGQDCDYMVVFCKACGAMAVEEHAHLPEADRQSKVVPPKIELLGVRVKHHGRSRSVKVDYRYIDDVEVPDGETIRGVTNSTTLGELEVGAFLEMTPEEREIFLYEIGLREWDARCENAKMETIAVDLQGQFDAAVQHLVGTDLLERQEAKMPLGG